LFLHRNELRIYRHDDVTLKRRFQPPQHTQVEVTWTPWLRSLLENFTGLTSQLVNEFKFYRILKVLPWTEPPSLHNSIPDFAIWIQLES
jgi:hypothetical protein